MSMRLLGVVVAAGLLSGCTWTWLEKSEPEKPQARSIGIGWIGHDWRACESISSPTFCGLSVKPT